MYKHGKPIKRVKFTVGLIIVAAVILAVGGGYLFLIKKTQVTEIKNSDKPLESNIAGASKDALDVDEPLFKMSLPGQWKETARNPDASYRSIQWNYVGKDSTGRWLRLYVDTIPASFAVNYLLPVSAQDNRLSVGDVSDNCVTFTQGATADTNRDVPTSISKETLPARWQQVSFTCDNSHVSHQVVGTGSSEAGNAATIVGSQGGKHRYFFVYNDANYKPNYSIFINILGSFEAK